MAQVISTFVLLGAIVFVFGIVFRQLPGETPGAEAYFGSGTQSMYTLVLCAAARLALLYVCGLLLCGPRMQLIALKNFVAHWYRGQATLCTA